MNSRWNSAKLGDHGLLLTQDFLKCVRADTPFKRSKGSNVDVMFLAKQQFVCYS